jgi:hypothetical protein
MPTADTAPLHPLQQFKRSLATAMRVGQVIAMKIAGRDLPRLQTQIVRLSADGAVPRDVLPRSDSDAFGIAVPPTLLARADEVIE